MSISLKHIPCPAGQQCTAFLCIFGHAGDVDQASPAEPAAERAKKSREDASLAEDGPRKRQKLEAGESGKSHPDGSRDDIKQAQPATRSPAPPPPPSKARAQPRKVGTVTLSTASSTPEKPASAAKDQPQKPRKPESLNPRLLKSSPASHETRLKLLRMLHHEYNRLNSELKNDGNEQETKLVLSDQDLVFRALDEEQKTALEKPAVYANVMKNKVIQYKRMKVAQWVDERQKEMKAAHGGTASSEPKEIETGLTPAQEVRLLQRLLTPTDTLSSHGYVSAVPSEKAIETMREGIRASKSWEKCDRCTLRFQVFPGRREEDGALASGGMCNFHWGKTYIPEKAPGDRTKVPKRYQCCGQEVGESAGCHAHDHHVFKTSNADALATVLNYAETPENSQAPADRAVCFDCEMGYTVYGMELIRLTATSWPSGEELLDVLVQPLGEILDLNSRYSGVWPDDLALAEAWEADEAKGGEEAPAAEGNAKVNTTATTKKKLKRVPSPEAARDLFFSLISPSTPLIGHGLENDLNALRVVHPTLIDTVLLYPHQRGLPFRYGLKKLMDEHLNRKIQQETGPKMLGHDSAEDARAAGDLVRLRVMNTWKDMKRAGWTLVDDDFVPPGGGGSGDKRAKEGNLTEDFIEA
ncbi:hypothetical protein CDD83_11068 [Cordyceps sp. RAO-2017]|nr:hypothetical protein CDD83_11068 [Cordyceps sp. RAO-2017]